MKPWGLTDEEWSIIGNLLAPEREGLENIWLCACVSIFCLMTEGGTRQLGFFDVEERLVHPRGLGDQFEVTCLPGM